MNFQDILDPIASGCQWFFVNLLEPSSHWFNWVCVGIAFFGIIYWVRRQKSYNRAAVREKSIP